MLPDHFYIGRAGDRLSISLSIVCIEGGSILFSDIPEALNVEILVHVIHCKCSKLIINYS
jgi:hypothetical protein